MPIEIKELHIRVAVNVPQGGQAEHKAATVDSGKSQRSEEVDAIVAECVEQVLDILRNKMER